MEMEEEVENRTSESDMYTKYIALWILKMKERRNLTQVSSCE